MCNVSENLHPCTGLSNFSIKTGKQTGVPRALHGLGYSVVTELTSNHRGKYHHIILDNAFTSPALCHDLHAHDIYVTGTARVHRKGRIPVAKGERIARQQGPIMAMKYGDRKVVTFLSTFEGPR